MVRTNDASVSCDTCGTYTGLDTHCCGRCAEDSNDRDQVAGLRRINGRRKANGLAPVVRGREVYETRGGGDGEGS